MSTIIVFLMTLIELLAVLVGYFGHLPALLDAAIIDGSPPYFVINTLGSNSAFTQHPLFPALAAFHVIKYLALVRSQFVMERHSLHFLAVIFEIVYLAICFLNL